MSRVKVKKKLGKILRNNAFPFVLIGALMLMQMVALFTVSNWQKMDTYDEKINRELDNCISDAENVFENMKRIVISAKFDKEIIAALAKPDLNPIEQQRVFLQLSGYKKFINEISNLYVYSSSERRVYSTTTFTARSVDEFPFGKTRELLLKGWEGNQPLILLEKAEYQTDIYGGGVVIRLMMKYDNSSSDVIIADVGYDVVRDIFRDFETIMNGRVYIRSNAGEILYSGVDVEELPAELGNVEVEEKKAVRSYYGEEYLVKRKKIMHMDAEVFSVIPEENIGSGGLQTRTLLMINLVIVSLVVLFAVLITLFRNWRKMVKRDARELELIRQNGIRENFLKERKQLIDCFRHSTVEEIAECKQYIGKVFSKPDIKTVALARIDFCSSSDGKLSLAKKYELIKRAEEIFNNNILAYASYEQDDYVIFLLADTGFDHVGRCRKAYDECCDAFEGMNIVPACYVSSAAEVSGLHELYVEITNLAEYMFMYNRPMFLDFTLVFQNLNESDGWVENGISGIKNNIMTPSEDLAAQMDSFVSSLRELSVKEAKQAIYSLYLAIGQCTEQIHREDMSFNFNLLEYFPRLACLQSLDEARSLFVEMADQLQKRNTQSDSNKYAAIVKRSLEIIEQRLGDPALCRSMIADEIGISKPYLGRIFKEIVGISMSDAINDMRLKTVEEQLISTNKSIKELISDVGIVNQSYFTVMFKKKYGMSPSEYRNKKSNLS